MTYKRCMQDLYRRLRQCGFDAKFVRNIVLPDWWDDDLAENPANRAIAEMAIARHLGFRVADLQSPAAELRLPAVSDFRLKRRGGTTPAEVRPAVMVARRTAEVLLEALGELPTFRPRRSAPEVRRAILEREPYVTLQSLVDFCWENGIAVAHLDPKRLPRPSKKFDGLAISLEDRPVIILSSGRDSPPWLAFHLAHEMAHLLCGHVQPGTKPLVDHNIDRLNNERQEETADKYATQLLTGQAALAFAPKYGLTGERLAEAAQTYGARNCIDPGTVALIYGRSADRWGVAQNALKRMGQHAGAQKLINRALLSHLHPDRISESTAGFLRCLSAVSL